MKKRVKLKIRGGGGETDAPTIQDFLGQLWDFFEILKGIEEAIAGDAKAVIEWRIVNATTNSPISIEAEPYSRTYGVNIDQRVGAVTRLASKGMRELKDSPHRPPYFTDAVLQRAESFAERVTNGLDNAVIEYDDGEPPIEINRDVARVLERRINAILHPAPKAYRELGSVEGYFKSVEKDGFSRELVWLRHRLTGADVKCLVSNDGLRAKIANESIAEVWNQRRMLVSGTIHFKALGKIDYVDASDFRLLRQKSELPSIEDIQDSEFTGGMRSEEYLEKMWNGEIH